MGPGGRVMGTGWYAPGLLPERLPKSWAATPEVKLNIAPNVSAMVVSTIANDVFMFDSFQVSNHLEHEENLQRNGDSRGGICHTTLVPITTSQI